MRRAFGTFSGQDTWTTIPTQAERDACKTCIDSFQAPDPDTLAAVLTKVINQGASSGEFSAQQSLTDSIYELAGNVPQGTAPGGLEPLQPAQPLRPSGPAPVRVDLLAAALHGADPGLHAGRPGGAQLDGRGLRVHDRDGPAGNQVVNGDACRRWSANDKLVDRVSVGMARGLPAERHGGRDGRPVHLRACSGTAPTHERRLRLRASASAAASSPRRRTASSARPSTS